MSEAIACGTASWFAHVTSVPAFTVSVEGSNAKFLIVIVFPPVVGDCGDAGAG